MNITEEIQPAPRGSRRRRVAATARRVGRALASPLHRAPRTSFPKLAPSRCVGPDGRSSWLFDDGRHLVVLCTGPGRTPEVFVHRFSDDEESALTTAHVLEDRPPAATARAHGDETDAGLHGEPVRDDGPAAESAGAIGTSTANGSESTAPEE